MELDTRYSNHPTDSKHYTTEELREYYLINEVFKEDILSFTYSHYNRIFAGGIMPVNKALELEASQGLGQRMAKCLALSSANSNYINGYTIAVDGGWLSR